MASCGEGPPLDRLCLDFEELEEPELELPLNNFAILLILAAFQVKNQLRVSQPRSAGVVHTGRLGRIFLLDCFQFKPASERTFQHTFHHYLNDVMTPDTLPRWRYCAYRLLPLNHRRREKRCLLHQLFYTRFEIMAELNIGKHCRIDSCHQNDFLPFVCDLCRGSFCLDHRSREAHSCSEEPVKKEPRTTGGNKSYPCSFQDCRGKELLPVVCPQCGKQLCLAHRHQDDHECEKLEVQKPRMAATKELVQKIVESKDKSKSKGRRGAKSSATAAKVALMKLKLHAAGDKGLPQTERTYFQVYLPKDSKASSQPMFFCSKWSVGKAVDCAASLASLKNSNNILTAKKLRLCHPQTGEALQMDDTLLALLSHPETPLFNGGDVVLEYLENQSSGLDVSDYISQV